jgi:prepilin-type N-terminal cleavage/methylation domain-containing protein
MRTSGGVTLVELVVAMAIAGIVISLTLTSWTLIAKRTTLGKHRSGFYSQTEQAQRIIVDGVRKSSRVISFDKSAITFVADAGDTVSYAFDGDTLRKNGAALQFVTEGGKVVRFSVEKDSAASPPALSLTEQDIMLTITLGMKDRTGAGSEILSSVKIRYAPQNDLNNNKSRLHF